MTVSAMASGSSPSRVADEVLALVSGVPKTAGAILDAHSADPTTVRTPIPTNYRLYPPLD